VTVQEALIHGAAWLTAAGVDQPRLDARLLLAHAAGLDQNALLREPGAAIDRGAYDALLVRRAAREPVALITGVQEFWSLPFAVSPATLVPRADSETLIEAALAACGPVRRVLDLGTGTGCLLLAALSELPAAWGVGIDVSPAAAALARRNAAALGLDGRAAILCGSWADAVRGSFDLILGNPPYLRTEELAGLAPELAYEPARALDGGADGLRDYRAILAEAPRLLAPEGVMVLEVGLGQAASVMTDVNRAGFAACMRADLAGVPRAVVARRGLGGLKPTLRG